MDINRDEVRRQLREADEEQRSSITGFRDTLHRIFNNRDIPTAAKAELLGVPRRRQFLKIGGATVLGAAVLSACGSDNKGVGETGNSIATTTAAGGSTTGSTPTTSAADGSKMDLVLARTATSLEILAVAIYGVALGTSDMAKLPTEIAFDPAVVDAAKLFQKHHQAHADALNAVITETGQPKYTKPNQFLFDNLVKTQLPSLTTQQAVVSFAKDVEDIAAGTYAYAASVLSTPQLRQTLMSIGGVESRHASALALVLDSSGADAVPAAFTDASPQGRVPDDALVKA